MSASVSIDRTSLSKTALVISDSSATHRLTEGGVGYVVQSVRVTYAPDSINVDGSEVIGFAREATALPLEFHVFGSSAADLASKVAELQEAFYRLEYPVIRTVEGVSQTFSAGPCQLVPKRGSVDSGVVAQHFDTFTVAIPLPNPNAVA